MRVAGVRSRDKELNVHVGRAVAHEESHPETAVIRSGDHSDQVETAQLRREDDEYI